MESCRVVEVLKARGEMCRRIVTALELAALQREQGPEARGFFIASPDFDRLATDLPPAGAIRNRGRKHPRKSLSDYLLPLRGLSSIQAGYSDAGQAERGLRALLLSTDRRHAGAIYLVRVGETLFERLFQKAAPAGPGGGHRPGHATASARMLRLMQTNGGTQVPAALRQQYLGSSDEAELVRMYIVRAAESSCPVLILGETGTGKEVVANLIHRRSRRVGTGTFMPVNCAAIASELLESELFGHVKGAFTGAVGNKEGIWKAADEGTLFLDEIGDLSPRHQAKVLRALEDGQFRPVGGSRTESSDARIIAATNRNLEDLVARGLFRDDLYYRLFSVRIHTPALRDHPDDIPEFARHFWAAITRGRVPPLSADVLEELKHYRWPGNARELRAFLHNLHVVSGATAPTPATAAAVMSERTGRIPAPAPPERLDP